MTIFWIFLLFTFLNHSLFLINAATDLYLAKLKQIRCLDIDHDHIFNVTCQIRAVRGKNGLIDVRFDRRNVDHQMVHIKLFRQNSAGHYLPYLLDILFNTCEWSELEKTGSLEFKIMSRLEETKKFKINCPINVPYEMMNLDFNEFVSKNWPPYFPTGEYKFELRAFDKFTNKTYISIVFRVSFLAKGVKGSMADLSMLNMG